MLTEALILRTWPYSESTLIVQLLTPEHGVVRALAKGARSIKGRTAAAFDLFSHVRCKLRVRPGDGLGGVTSIDVRGGWPGLRHDVRRLGFASAGLEILGGIAAISPPEPFFFLDAVHFLNEVEKSEAAGSMVVLLILRLLHHAGHPPSLGSKLDPAALPARLIYDFNQECIVEALPIAPRGSIPLPASTVKHLLGALDHPPDYDSDFRLLGRDGPIALDFLVKICEDHLGREIKSVKFLEKTALGAKG